MSLNDSQKRAVAICDGPAVVLAGAGSGKTTVITHRIDSLIHKHHIDPSNILVITFTKAAANEMKSRYLQLAGQKTTKVTFGTFHAIFFMVLKAAYHFDASNIISEDQKYSLMRELIRKYRLDIRDENETASSLITEISKIKNSRIDIAYYYSKICADSVFRDIYREYHEKLASHKLIDFEDMMTYTYELFEKRPDILSLWQKKYQYILIDEFQDINQIQFDIIRMMAKPGNNLFIVGDDDQSIYRFRGSKPEIMLQFQSIYPDAKMVLLDTNYRSNQEICDYAMKLISHNKIRFDKKIKAAKQGKKGVEILEFESEELENAYIAKYIKNACESGANYSDFAVLYRTNLGPKRLINSLMSQNVIFMAKDKIPNLYDHWTVRDIRTYIKIAAGSRERSEIYQIMNKPLRYISRDSLPERTVAFDVWEDFYKDKPWMLERIEKLEQDLRIISTLSPYAAINYIRKAVGYDEYIEDFAQENGLKKEELFDVLDEFQGAAKGFQTYRQFQDYILKSQELIRELNEKKQVQSDAVTLSTLHSAKGLEFKNVFIIDVNEGVIPYKKALLEEDIEEERRLLYVGMTRAKDKLILCSVNDTKNNDILTSHFIDEID